MSKDINGSKPTQMPLEESRLPFKMPHYEEPAREPIIKLGQMLTDRVGVKVTKDDPEYWGLAGVITDEMAEVALKMKVRKPKTLAQLAKLTKKDPAELEKLLDEMSYVGLIEYNWENLDGKNPQHEKRYVLPRFIPGSTEFLNMRHSQIDEHPEVAAFFERMTFLPLEKITPMVPPGGAGIGMHVIPVEKAIETEQQSIDLEHISYWLSKYEGKYAKSMCSCRASRAKLGEGCGDDPESWCVALGDMADYIVETQRGEYITKEEALEIFKKAEDNGFVHQITNIDGEQKIFGICNCNVNICNALRTSQLFNTPNLSRSAYVAQIERDNCVACGRCVESCPAGAIKLGQKLCTQQGEIEYPRQELPDEVKWGPEKWSVDYRDRNRINCYPTGTAPCKAACPAHIAVQGYLKLAAEGRYTEALALIKKENPFPAVCGRICNHRCETECTRGTVDEAVAIDEVKRFIAQQDLDAKTRFVPEKVIPRVDGEFSEKIAIIGAGPAGMSCAYYLAEKGYRPTVFEKASRPGGMLMNGIPSFRLEKDVVEAEIDILREMGVEFRCGVEVGKDITIQQLREQGYKGFYVAVGLQACGKLNIPGEDAEGVQPGVDFLKQINLEGAALTGKVVVIGGGNIGADVARTAVRCGAESVDLYCLERYEEMPMGEEDRSECERDGVTIHAGWGQTEILTEDGKCAGIRFRKCLSVKNAEGRFAPTFDDAVTEQAECTTVLYCIGQRVEWKKLLDGTKVEFNPNGTAKADPLTYQTAEPDIFVGGDAYTGQKFAIDAIAAGKEGAVSLHRWVHPGQTLTMGRDRHVYRALDKQNALIPVDEFDSSLRQRVGYNEALRRTFRDERVPFTEEQIKKETARCLSCGATKVDEYLCVGCGLCTTRCAFDAIHIKKAHDWQAGAFESMPIKVAEQVVKKAGRIAAKPFRK